MPFTLWLKKNKFIAWARFQWAKFVIKFNSLFNHPIQHHQSQLVSLLASREEVEGLYQTLIKGKDCEFAFQKLQRFAANSGDEHACWAHKVLSYLYRKGLNRDHFMILPNGQLAKHHYEKAVTGITLFKEKLKVITRKLIKLASRDNKAEDLVKKVADTGCQYANYKYARFLEKRHEAPEKFMPFYTRATKDTKEAALDIATPGDQYAINYLYGVKPTSGTSAESSHKKLQSLLNVQDKMAYESVQKILLQKADNVTITENDLELANSFFDKLRTLKRSVAEQHLFEKLCLKLADRYEALFIKEPSSLTPKLSSEAQSLVRKVVSYLKFIPPSSKKYSVAQFRIANFQKYHLHQETDAIKTFEKLAQNGDDDCAFMAIAGNFKQYWDQQKNNFSEKEKEIIQHHEQRNTSFVENMKPKNLSKAGGLQTSLQLLKKIATELREFNRENKNFSTVQLLEKNIETFISIIETNPAGNNFMPRPQIKGLFDYVGRFKPELKNKYSFLWEQNKSQPNQYQHAAMLQGLLDFIAIIKDKKLNQTDKLYYQLVERVFFQHVVSAYKNIFTTANAARSNDDDQLLTNNGGPRVCMVS